MFADQPITGAKAYYVRTVLHDSPDKQAVEILRRIKGAMSPGSPLLINESVMPEENPTWFQTKVDFQMMLFFAAGERTEK